MTRLGDFFKSMVDEVNLDLVVTWVTLSSLELMNIKIYLVSGQSRVPSVCYTNSAASRKFDQWRSRKWSTWHWLLWRLLLLVCFDVPLITIVFNHSDESIICPELQAASERLRTAAFDDLHNYYRWERVLSAFWDPLRPVQHKKVALIWKERMVLQVCHGHGWVCSAHRRAHGTLGDVQSEVLSLHRIYWNLFRPARTVSAESSASTMFSMSLDPRRSCTNCIRSKEMKRGCN